MERRMRKPCTAYGAFASRWIRLFFCGLLPVGLIAAQAASVTQLGMSLTVVIVQLLVMGGCALDARTFGGCCSGQAYRMDFFRTSARGRRVLRGSLLADCLLRLTVYAVTLGCCFLLDCSFLPEKASAAMFGNVPVFGWLWCVAVVCGVSMLTVGICRYFTLRTWDVLGAYVGVIVALMLTLLGAYMAERLTVIGRIIMTVVSLSAMAAVCVWSVWNVLRKVERCAYDGEG